MEYREKQYFNQIWIKIISFVSLITGIVTSLLFIIKESDYWLAFITFFVCFLIFIFFNTAFLDIHITKDTIRFKFFPFHLKYREVSLNENTSLEIVQYNPISDFGGWGIRENRDSVCYSTAGNFAVKIKEQGKKNLLLGTLQPNEIKIFFQLSLTDF